MTDYLIVLNKDEDTVSFIDEPTGKIVKTVSVGKNPHEVSVTPNGQKAYISCAGENTVEVFDMKKLELVTITKHPSSVFLMNLRFSPMVLKLYWQVPTQTRYSLLMLLQMQSKKSLKVEE